MTYSLNNKTVVMKGVFSNTQDYTLCYNILKKAYLMKSQNINSEDKPEEFM